MQYLAGAFLAFLAVGLGLLFSSGNIPSWKSGGLVSVGTPSGGQRVNSDLPNGGVNITDYRADGSIRRDTDYIPPAGGQPDTPKETVRLRGSMSPFSSRERGGQQGSHRSPTLAVRGQQESPPPQDCNGELRRDKARKAWVCREYH